MAIYNTNSCKSTANNEKQTKALNRAIELKEKIMDYLANKDSIKTGFDLQETILRNKNKLLEYFNSTDEDWNNWKWQMSHRITDATILSKLFGFSNIECAQIKIVEMKYRWAISPYYASLMEMTTSHDPIKAQGVPSIEEMNESGHDDPMAEEFTSPVPSVTRRYPDRLIINVTNQCGVYCRHCQRRRNIKEIDRNCPDKNLWKTLDYIQKNKEIRDVLITGGDALMLSNQKLDWLLSELDNINHVEIKRLGTRTIVTLPQRINQELCDVLKKHPPLYINTQFNHPREITPESKLACDRLIEAGIVLGNQTVLLKNINNSPYVIRKLNQELLKIRVRPYYLFHAKPVKGTLHFVTSIDDGITIMENLRGYTSGLAIPTYIINAPNGYGKVPILPNYLLDKKEGSVKLRTWENRVLKYDI